MNPLDKLIATSEAEKDQLGLRHTPREIKQQPETWRATYAIVAASENALRNFLRRAGVGGDEIKQGRPAVFLIGAGTSDYIGRSLAALLRLRWGCEVTSVPSTDLLTNLADYIRPHQPYLWISFSRSGESSEGVAVIQAALEKYPEIQHLLITCNGDGRMARDFTERANVFCLTLDPRTNDHGLAMTSSFSSMIVAGQCLAHLNDLANYKLTLANLTNAGERFLGDAATAAERLAATNFAQVCFLGTGPLGAVATESALKVLELTGGGVKTLAESYLGIRHGPLSAINEDTLVVGYLSNDERRRSYERDLLTEIKDKHLTKHLLAVSAIAEDTLEDIQTIGLADAQRLNDYYLPPVYVMFGQLLGLFMSLQRDLRPDEPSPKGTITRVVAKVKIY